MKSTFSKLKILSLLGFMPAIYGCGAGGGALGALFGAVGGGVASAFGGGGSLALDSGGGSGGIGVATFHNPEPTSMALLGTGMAAMALYRKFKK